jgi:ketosteroid isomerase-like protein
VSQQNVEIVRGLVAALNHVDIEAMVEDFYAPDAEFIPAIQAALEGTTYRGSNQIRAYYEEIFDVWRELRVHLEEVRDLGDTVAATGYIATRGKTSGAELNRPWAFVFKLASGKVVWQQNFASPADALKAVGLEE